MHVNCRDFNVFSSHGLLPSGLVDQSVERRRSNPKVVGSVPTLIRVFLCPCVGPVPSVGLTLTWFIWDRNIVLHVTLHSLQLILFKKYVLHGQRLHKRNLSLYFCMLIAVTLTSSVPTACSRLALWLSRWSGGDLIRRSWVQFPP